MTKIIEKKIRISKFDNKNSISMFLFSLFYEKMLYNTGQLVELYSYYYQDNQDKKIKDKLKQLTEVEPIPITSLKFMNILVLKLQGKQSLTNYKQPLMVLD